MVPSYSSVRAGLLVDWWRTKAGIATASSPLYPSSGVSIADKFRKSTSEYVQYALENIWSGIE